MKRCKNCREKTTPSYGRCTSCGYLMERMRTEDHTQAPDANSSGTSVHKVAWSLHDLPQSLIAVAFLMSLIPVGVAMSLIPNTSPYFGRTASMEYVWIFPLIHILSFAFAMAINIALYRLWCEIILPAIRSKLGG